MKKTRISYKQKEFKQKVELYIIGVEQYLHKSVYKTPFKIRKTVWFGKLADPDMFIPSCPHLHSLDGKYKLNVYTGELYDIRTRTILKNRVVNKDELKKLWNDPKFLEFAIKIRKIYCEKFPKSEMTPFPSYVRNIC